MDENLTVMESIEKAEALTEIVKARLEKYRQTRDLQFKVNIALWTLIVLVGSRSEQILVLSDRNDYLFFGVVVLAVVLGHYFFWLGPMSASMARDNAKALELQQQAVNLINSSSDKPERSLAEIKQCYRTTNFFLSGITLILMLLLGIFLAR